MLRELAAAASGRPQEGKCSCRHATNRRAVHVPTDASVQDTAQLGARATPALHLEAAGWAGEAGGEPAVVLELSWAGSWKPLGLLLDL